VGNNNDGERDWRKEDEKKEKEERSGVIRLLSLSLWPREAGAARDRDREKHRLLDTATSAPSPS
jgi:hypothetical protein